MCSAAESGCLPFVKAWLAEMSAPGQTQTVIPGADSPVAVLWGGNLVTQFMPNDSIIINGSNPTQWLANGYVIRWIGVQDGNVSIWTYGREIILALLLKGSIMSPGKLWKFR